VTCSGTGSFDSPPSARQDGDVEQPGAGGAAASNYALSTTSATTTANITAATLTPAITATNKIYDGHDVAAISCTLTGVRRRRRRDLQRHRQLRHGGGRHGQDGHVEQPGARRRGGQQLRAVDHERDDDGQHHRGDADTGDHAANKIYDGTRSRRSAAR
jgi:hypothetical protein